MGVVASFAAGANLLRRRQKYSRENPGLALRRGTQYEHAEPPVQDMVNKTISGCSGYTKHVRRVSAAPKRSIAERHRFEIPQRIAIPLAVLRSEVFVLTEADVLSGYDEARSPRRQPGPFENCEGLHRGM